MLKKFMPPFLITLLVVSVLFSSGTMYMQVQELTKEKEMYKEKAVLLEKKYTEIQDLITVITPETFEKRVKSGEKMYVYIGRPDCGDCASLDHELAKYIKANKAVEQKLIFVNVRILRENQDQWESFRSVYNVIGTPHFALWENGQQVSKSEWTKEQGYSMSVLQKWAIESELV